jgi:ParB family transcriptional regulator, chromosome partitioning protein
MGKADELLKTMGGAILESASHRGPPAAMPSPQSGVGVNPDRLAGVVRSKASLEIPLVKIGRDPDQPREEFDEDALSRLSDSIRTKGLIQPISVRWVEGQGKYLIIAGERRWRAATMAGLPTISCVVVDRPLPPGELLALQCVENLLREDLRPIEQAKAFRTLMDVNGWSGNQLSKELGVSQPAVVAALKLLSLPDPVQDLVDRGDLPASSASAIASLEDPAAQREVAERVVAEKLSRAETVEAVRRASKPKVGGKGQGRGVAKAKAKLPTERTIKVDGGFKVIVVARKGFDGQACVEALRDALRQEEDRLGGTGERIEAA